MLTVPVGTPARSGRLLGLSVRTCEVLQEFIERSRKEDEDCQSKGKFLVKSNSVSSNLGVQFSFADHTRSASLESACMIRAAQALELQHTRVLVPSRSGSLRTEHTPFGSQFHCLAKTNRFCITNLEKARFPLRFPSFHKKRKIKQTKQL